MLADCPLNQSSRLEVLTLVVDIGPNRCGEFAFPCEAVATGKHESGCHKYLAAVFAAHHFFSERNRGEATGLFSSQCKWRISRIRLISRAARQRALRMLEPPSARIRL